ncbi:Delta-1-pyrroline-5-carboxylate synthetase [Phytophthora palmivora]|uniref:Delta-1-pyrroline-5-carboxylate synthetase n=1 Tax=Phytophthora palmivora TaxID=4796 RepID=A0A2P4YK19_9STRA|nr:Delta-1-pyrroline-5-carboxylate synthetase [Phytophthora palmivora]
MRLVSTEIVHSPEGLLATGQIGNIVEQIPILHMRDHNTIFVSSGSITIINGVASSNICCQGPCSHICEVKWMITWPKLDVGLIPVINENNVITRRSGPLLPGTEMAWNNDALVSLFAQDMQAGHMVIITDVDSIYMASSLSGKERSYFISRFQRGNNALALLKQR